MDKAHAAMEKELRQIGNQDNIIIYIDGTPATEKQKTHAEQAEQWAKALDKAEKVINELNHQINSDMHVTKALFNTAKQHLAGSFSWAPEAKESLAKYLCRNKWEVVECDTEADVQIACDCGPSNIVVSWDSDFLAYSTVKTICDNLASLGAETNYKIVKNLQEHVVVANNVHQETFKAAIHVFHHHQQNTLSSATATALSSENVNHETPSTSDPSTSEAGPAHPLLPELSLNSPHPHQSMPANTAKCTKKKLTYSSMWDKFDLLHKQQNLNKQQFWETKLSNN
ncbi:hypothetical protein BGZ74_010021, partial [Mortierella antarctica]